MIDKFSSGLKRLLVFFSFSIAFLAIFFHFFSHSEVTFSKKAAFYRKKNFAASSFFRNDQQLSFVELEDKKFYEDLPVASVEVQKSSQNKGTVLFLPQYHRTPGSDLQDVQNDKAEKTQNQTYQILKKIVQKVPAQLIMVEGELYGNVDSQKKAELSQKIAKHQKLQQSYAEVKSFFPNKSTSLDVSSRVFESIESLLGRLNREIFLQGAPQKLWAEGNDFTLIGAENPQTIEKSKKLVRDHLYLQDRLTALQNPSNRSFGMVSADAISLQSSDQSALMNIDKYQLLLKLLQKPQVSLEKEIEVLAESVKNTNLPAFQALQQLKTLFLDYTQKENFSVRTVSPSDQTNANGLPSRENNPYSDIQDSKQIEQLLKENEQNIQEIILEQRNKETALNFARALEENGEKFGILQYGAGHTEGLTQELQKLGMNVIVVVPQEVQAE